ncbi:MAG: hypothetical protein P4L50_13050 [Anaerolineaceae bacterium]|nr:hypothetical protein [Anaerolineaceae bacterium]
MGLIFWAFQPSRASGQTLPTAILVVIPAPTPTALALSQALFTATKTAAPSDKSGISLGVFVQIQGTGQDGLRIRSGPGTSQTTNFLGMDSEVFKVKDGPVQSDGFTWWFLVAPYDQNRNGWAASNYLTIVSATATP